MQLRNLFLGVVVGATFVLAACDARPDPDPDEEDAGCIGACQPQPDAGPDAGPTPDAGRDAGMELTIAELMELEPENQRVILRDVVVHTIYESRAKRDNDACPANTTRAKFWVADPQNPDGGAFVDKFCAGPAGTNNYLPDAGDVLTVEGFYRYEDSTVDTHAYRPRIGDAFIGSGAPRLVIRVTGKTDVPTPVSVGDAGVFGDAQMGAVAADEDRRAQYVHINGPLEVIDAFPRPLFNMSGPCFTENCVYDRSGARLEAVPQDGGYAVEFASGFMVTGGIIVVDDATYRACNYKAIAGDGGQSVVFEEGISGTWDTYAATIYCSPFPACKHDAFVPGGTDAGYTMVLYPSNCARDFGTVSVTPR